VNTCIFYANTNRLFTLHPLFVHPQEPRSRCWTCRLSLRAQSKHSHLQCQSLLVLRPFTLNHQIVCACAGAKNQMLDLPAIILAAPRTARISHDHLNIFNHCLCICRCQDPDAGPAGYH
jgi:hypothetical protein